MNVYEKNMEILKYKNISLCKDIEISSDASIKESTRDEIDGIKVISAVDNNNILEISKKNHTFRMNSIYDINYEVEKWLEGIDLQAIKKVVILFGFSNGFYIEKLLSKLNEDDVIIIYEPSMHIYKFTMENFLLEKIIEDKRVYLYIGHKDIENFRRCLRQFVYINNIATQTIAALPQYDRLFIDDYKAFLNIIRENNKSVMLGENTNAFFGKIAVENMFSNLKYVKDCNIINDYYNVFPKNIPVIIVAAGPSLEKNIRYLKDAKGKAVIFCVDRALEFLYEEGILPDYAVTLDPIKPAEYFGKGSVIDIPLFVEINSSSKILDVHIGKKIIYDPFMFLDNILYKIGKKIDGGNHFGKSVATAAFAIAIQLGFKKIVMIGQDLAYANDGKTSHAGANMQQVSKEDEIWVDGTNGAKVKSRYDWYEYLTWFKDVIELNADKGIEFINATEGGALIQGTKTMKLSEVLESLPDNGIDIKKIENNLSPTYTKSDLNKIERYVMNGIDELVSIKRKASVLIKLSDQMITKCKRNSQEDKTGRNLTERIMKGNEYIALKSMYPLIDCYITDVSRSIMKDIYQISDDQQKNMEDTFIQSKQIYQLIIQAADEIKSIIESKFEPWSKENLK